MPAPVLANYGRIVVLKRTGQDSASFDLTDAGYLFGRGVHCDIRIQLATISEEHCRVYRDADGNAILENVSTQGTIVNGITLDKNESCILKSGDVITVVERSFRYESDEVIPTEVKCVTPMKEASHMMDVTGAMGVMGAMGMMEVVESFTAGMQVDSPIKVANTPVKIGMTTPQKKSCNTPAKTPSKMATTPIQAEIESEVESRVESVTPLKMAESPRVESVTPLKTESVTPLKIESVTPLKIGSVTPLKTMESPKVESANSSNTLLKTPVKVTTLTKAAVTPEKSPMKASTPITHYPNLGSPMKVIESPRKLGSPMRVQTPTKATSAAMTPNRNNSSPANIKKDTVMTPNNSESTIAPTIETCLPGSTEKTLTSENDWCVIENSEVITQESCVNNHPDINNLQVVTPSKQMEVIQPTTLPSVSKFKVDHQSPTTNTPIAVRNSDLLLSTPPSRQSMASPNINMLFPPTPALAAASRLAESIAVEASGTLLRGSKMSTPRSPRFSVASGGSPVVVDAEITASPKLKRVDFFEEPFKAESFVDDDETENTSLVAKQDEMTLVVEPTIQETNETEAVDDDVDNDNDVDDDDNDDDGDDDDGDGDVDALIEDPINTITENPIDNRSLPEDEEDSETGPTPRRSSRRMHTETPSAKTPSTKTPLARTIGRRGRPSITPEQSATKSKRSKVITTTVEPVVDMSDDSQVRRSTRKTPAATIKTPATSKKQQSTDTEAEKVQDATSPSLHPRGAARGKGGKSSAELVDENSNPNGAKNATTRTPNKRTSEGELVESEENGRRRSARSRTPAKAH